MNAKLQQILEARKRKKAAGKANFKQTHASKAPSDAFNAPKKGLSGAGPEGAKTPLKPKKLKESNIPAFGARFNRLFEQTLAEHQNILAEDDASDLYYEYDMMKDDDQMDADIMGTEDEMGGDEVTLTLDKSTAQALLSVLQAAVGGEEEEEEGGEEEGGEEEGGYGDDNEFADQLAGESKDEDEDEDEDKEVVEEEGNYSIKGANLAAGTKLTQPGSKTVKSKLGMRPGKASPSKGYDSSCKLSPVGKPKQMPYQVKSNMSSVGKDLF